MANRAEDWLAQADRNLAQARESGDQARHELPVPPPPELIERAKVLDNYYGPIQSRGAIEHADAILEFVRAEMAG